MVSFKQIRHQVVFYWLLIYSKRRPVETTQLSMAVKVALIALGGDVEREIYAVYLAQLHEYRSAVLYLTSGSLDEEYPGIKELGNRCIIDRTAVDTLTNFTTLLPSLIASRVTHVVCVTSKCHARRANAIARMLLGSRGIQVKMQVTPWASDGPSESLWRIARDILRSLTWLCTGWSGESIALWFYPERRPCSRTR